MICFSCTRAVCMCHRCCLFHFVLPLGNDSSVATIVWDLLDHQIWGQEFASVREIFDLIIPLYFVHWSKYTQTWIPSNLLYPNTYVLALTSGLQWFFAWDT